MKNAIIAVGLIVSGAAILLAAAPVFAVIDIARRIVTATRSLDKFDQIWTKGLDK